MENFEFDYYFKICYHYIRKVVIFYSHLNFRKAGEFVLEVKRKDNEGFEGFMRRFSKKTLQSGRLIQAKKIMFHQKPLSKRAQKERAKKREETKNWREYLRKIGKLDELLENKHKGKLSRR